MGATFMGSCTEGRPVAFVAIGVLKPKQKSAEWFVPKQLRFLAELGAEKVLNLSGMYLRNL